MAFEPGDLWSAWTACRSAREEQLFSDPLLHAEFEIADVPPGSDFTPEQVAVDVRTRPKQSGGVRTELLPDPHTATLLQAVADRLRRNDASAAASALSESSSGLKTPGAPQRHHTSAAASAPQAPHGVRLAANQYEEWSSDVRTWIRKELAAGRFVVYADIENFFQSIPAPAVAGVLKRSGLDPHIEGLTTGVLDRLRKLGRRSAAPGAGLPVCPGDFFWLVADRVLVNVDTALDRASNVLGHTRWSDDFLLSARPGAERAALRRLARCAGDDGFKLNARKTRVFSSWQDYQTRHLASEHESVNDLIAVHRNGGSKSEVEVLPAALNSLESADREGAARLLKRAYNLAALARTPALVGRAEADLERYPVVERSLFRYLAALGWPKPGSTLLLRAIRRSSHDTLALSALSALLNDRASPQFPPEVKPALLDASFGSSPCHPLARVAALASLVRVSPVAEHARLAGDFLDGVPGLESASARRAALALAWLVPTLRDRVTKLVREDDSTVVRDLWTCLAPSPGRQVRRGLERVAFGGGPTRWGGLERRLARALGGWQSVPNGRKPRPGSEAARGSWHEPVPAEA